MNYNFSNKVSSLAPSVIREILKYSSIPGMIPFSAGNPSPEAFPVEQIEMISREIFSTQPIEALQYSITEGYAPLKDYLNKFLKDKYNIGSNFDSLLVTSGAQQVMDLATKSLCNEGDVIITESPSFIGSLNCFRSYNAKLIGVKMQSDGMDLNELEAVLRANENVKFIYTIPNFQNPSGLTTSLEKRKGIYALAKQYGVLILEDNPYGDLRFEGENIPSIKSLDEDGIVIYAGSFSKVLSPGLRVGYAVAPSEIIAKMTVCKQTSDVHTTAFSQILTYKFLETIDFDLHLEMLRRIYKQKANLMMDLMDEHFGGKISYNKVQGGLFIWCSLPQNVDMLQFCKAGIERKVAVVPGSAFLIDESEPCRNFRMNYSTPTNSQIEQGIEILGELIKEY